jgi:transcriptional regulator with XRE-family HTH domain
VDPEWFKDRLRELRSKAGLTRQQLADKAGLKLNVIRDVEQGVNRPSWDTVIALCRALDVSCDAFLQPPSPELPPPVVGRPKKASAAAAEANVEEQAGDALRVKRGAIKKGVKAKGK